MANKPLNFDLTPDELAAGRHQPKISSNYTGVNWSKGKGKWQAEGKFNGKWVGLGVHDTEVAAAKKWDEWAHPLGKSVNFPEDFAGKKVVVLRPAALPEANARARGEGFATARDAAAGRPARAAYAGEVSAQELEDLKGNAASLGKLPTRRGAPKDRSELPTAAPAKGKSKAAPKKRRAKGRDSDDDSSSSSKDDREDSDSEEDSEEEAVAPPVSEEALEAAAAAAEAPAAAACRYEGSQGPSDYELLRLKNIARNQEAMKALGLDAGSNVAGRRGKRPKKRPKKAQAAEAPKKKEKAAKKAPKKAAKSSKWPCHMVRLACRLFAFCHFRRLLSLLFCLFFLFSIFPSLNLYLHIPVLTSNFSRIDVFVISLCCLPPVASAPFSTRRPTPFAGSAKRPGSRAWARRPPRPRRARPSLARRATSSCPPAASP